MSLLATLAREHRLFDKLIARLRSAAEQGDKARIELLLTLLLPALDRHDGLETLVFAHPDLTWPSDERRAHELVEAQHDVLRGLRAEAATILKAGADPNCPRLTLLADALAAKLEWHLKTEELLLWPIQAKRPGRSVARSLEREAEKGADDLERALAALREEEEA